MATRSHRQGTDQPTLKSAVDERWGHRSIFASTIRGSYGNNRLGEFACAIRPGIGERLVDEIDRIRLRGPIDRSDFAGKPIERKLERSPDVRPGWATRAAG
jgi:hypothetical protein